MKITIARIVPVAAGIIICLSVYAENMDGQLEIIPETLQADPAKTATNLDGIDLNDTTEDPAYAEAGEVLAKAAADGVIGEIAPLAVMTTIDGDIIDLAEVYGKKPVYIKFWATWCTPCRQQMPGFENTYKSLGDKMQIIALNIGLSDDEASIRAFRDKYNLTMPIVIDDGRLAKLFHLNVTPQHVIIGKDNRFAYIGHAENDALQHALQHAVAAPQSDVSVPAASSEVEPIVRLGDVVPEIKVQLLNGENVALQARSGRLLAVQFFSSWCEWYLETSRPETSKACARVRESIEKIAAENLAVDWLGIAGGPWATEQDLADYKKNNNVSIPLALDQSNTLFRTFGIRDIPTIALINESGQLIRLIGPNEKNLSGILRAAIAEDVGSK